MTKRTGSGVWLLTVLGAAVLALAAFWWLSESPSDDVEPDAPAVLAPRAPATADRTLPDPDTLLDDPDPDATPPFAAVDESTPVTGHVEGRLVTQDRRPVADATVAALEGTPLGFTRGTYRSLGVSSSVRGDGRFLLEDVPVTSQLVVRAEGEVFPLTEQGPFAVRAGETTQLGDIVVERGMIVAGTVHDTLGRPVSGARVALHRDLPVAVGSQPAEEPRRRAVSDAQGRFELSQVGRAPFRLHVLADGFASAFVAGAPPSDPSLSMAVLHVTLRAAVPLRGRVLAKRGGKPLSGARVVASPIDDVASVDEAVTDADGNFTFASLVPANYTVRADKSGYSSTTTRTWRDQFEEELLLELPLRGSLSGNVVDRDGQAVRHFDVRLRHAKGKQTFAANVAGSQRVRNEAGAFKVKDLEPGFYTVEAWSKGYSLTISEPVRVKQGEDVVGMRIRLQPEASLTGVVHDDLGTPVAAASVSMHPNREPEIEFLRGSVGEQAWLKRTVTDEAGRFVLPMLTAGTYQLQVDHPTHAVLRLNDVPITAASHEDLGVLSIDRAATVRGAALDRNGQPIAGLMVHLGKPASGVSSRSARTSSTGEFLFDRVSAGAYTLQCFGRGADLATTIQHAVQAARDLQAGLEPETFQVYPGEDLVRNVYAIE